VSVCLSVCLCLVWSEHPRLSGLVLLTGCCYCCCYTSAGVECQCVCVSVCPLHQNPKPNILLRVLASTHSPTHSALVPTLPALHYIHSHSAPIPLPFHYFLQILLLLYLQPLTIRVSRLLFVLFFAVFSLVARLISSAALYEYLRVCSLAFSRHQHVYYHTEQSANHLDSCPFVLRPQSIWRSLGTRQNTLTMPPEA
jgi:hypothetical protein